MQSSIMMAHKYEREDDALEIGNQFRRVASTRRTFEKKSTKNQLKRHGKISLECVSLSFQTIEHLCYLLFSFLMGKNE